MSSSTDASPNRTEQLNSLLVIADDVTGAADSAARCHNAGLNARIDLTVVDSVTSEQYLPVLGRPGTVLAVTTDSRFLAAEQAAERVTTVATALAPLARAGVVRWYKKIDSTLRGNLGSEIAALLSLVTPAETRPCALICPAFPGQQRSLIEGYLCYRGMPPRTMHLPTLLAEQSDLPIGAIALNTIRAGQSTLRHAIQRQRQAGQVLLVADAETEADLEQLLQAVTAVAPQALLCGSAGLVGVLAQQMAATMPAPASPPTATPAFIQKPVLAIIGSGSSIATQQIAHLRANTTTLVVEIDPSGPRAAAQSAAEIAQAWQAMQGNIALHLPTPAPGTALEGELARTYAIELAAVAHALLPLIEPKTLLLTGGDTAVHTLAMLQSQQLTVWRELLPGIPLTSTKDGHGNDYQIILKAGNHGESKTLTELLQSAETGAAGTAVG